MKNSENKNKRTSVAAAAASLQTGVAIHSGCRNILNLLCRFYACTVKTTRATLYTSSGVLVLYTYLNLGLSSVNHFALH